jgi:hypothetical protein
MQSAYFKWNLPKAHRKIPMKTMNLRLLPCLSVLAGLLMSTSAHAVWVVNSGATSGIANCTTTTGGVANSCTSSSSTNRVDTNTVSVAGYAVTNAGGSTGTSFNGGFSSTTSDPGKWAAATMVAYTGTGGGLGVNSDGNSTAPNHATDNNGKTEAVLLSFDSAIALTSIGMGYTASGYCSGSGGISSPTTTDTCASGTRVNTQTDGSTGVDISLFRWVGTGAPTLAGTSASAMGSWQLVGNYGDITADNTNAYNLVNSGGLTSSYWLISAYNSGFATTNGVTESRGALTNGDDYFKLYAAAGVTCSTKLTTNGTCDVPRAGVPEPASLALTSIALLGAVGVRRRKAKAA